jgi:hypothetical protein
MVIELVAQPGPGYSISGGGKNVTATLGAQIELAVYSNLTGSNNTQLIGQFAGGGADDTKNDETLQIVTGSFASSAGGLLGNFNATPGPLNYDPHVAPFEAGGSQNGTASDFDSDGDLDIGATGTDVTNMWVARTDSPTAAVRIDGTSNGWSKNSGASGFQDDDVVVNSATSRLRVGTLFFTVTGAGGTTLLNYIPRPSPEAGSGLWFEDGAVTGHTNGTDPIGTGVPVTIGHTSIPEPGAAALGTFATIGLLARRRQQQPLRISPA